MANSEDVLTRANNWPPYCMEFMDREAQAVNDEACELIEALAAQVRELRRDRARLEAGLRAVSGLIAESKGVYGLHLNGDISPWDELRGDGYMSEWLADFDAAMGGGEGEAK